MLLSVSRRRARLTRSPLPGATGRSRRQHSPARRSRRALWGAQTRSRLWKERFAAGSPNAHHTLRSLTIEATIMAGDGRPGLDPIVVMSARVEAVNGLIDGLGRPRAQPVVTRGCSL